MHSSVQFNILTLLFMYQCCFQEFVLSKYFCHNQLRIQILRDFLLAAAVTD
jgi:hypothetical protein